MSDFISEAERNQIEEWIASGKVRRFTAAQAAAIVFDNITRKNEENKKKQTKRMNEAFTKMSVSAANREIRRRKKGSVLHSD